MLFGGLSDFGTFVYGVGDLCSSNDLACIVMDFCLDELILSRPLLYAEHEKTSFIKMHLRLQDMRSRRIQNSAVHTILAALNTQDSFYKYSLGDNLVIKSVLPSKKCTRNIKEESSVGKADKYRSAFTKHAGYADDQHRNYF